jgi:hypothetical protein
LTSIFSFVFIVFSVLDFRPTAGGFGEEGDFEFALEGFEESAAAKRAAGALMLTEFMK